MYGGAFSRTVVGGRSRGKTGQQGQNVTLNVTSQRHPRRLFAVSGGNCPQPWLCPHLNHPIGQAVLCAGLQWYGDQTSTIAGRISRRPLVPVSTDRGIRCRAGWPEWQGRMSRSIRDLASPVDSCSTTFETTPFIILNLLIVLYIPVHTWASINVGIVPPSELCPGCTAGR